MNGGLRALAIDRRAVSGLEFALIMPGLLVLLMGLADLCFQSYVQSVLTGAVQKAARDATLEANVSNTSALDAKVQSTLQAVVPNATFSSVRLNFDNYSAIAGEPFTDSKYPNTSSGVYDGKCDHGETYVDVNGNGQYDLDLSASGEGGANDISKYTVTVVYNRLFPIAKLIGWNNTVTLSAVTILKNQPYATQSTNGGTGTGTCA